MTSIALDCGEIPWLHSSSGLAAVINNGYVHDRTPIGRRRGLGPAWMVLFGQASMIMISIIRSKRWSTLPPAKLRALWVTLLAWFRVEL
jgi:hypothetical protein